MEEAGYLYS